MALLACWALLPINYSASNAQTTTYQIGDDGYAHVPIPFSFPLYTKTFTESWMYDNGVVSFLKPGTPGALNPGQWNAPGSLAQTNANYFIAALWSDLSPTTNTVYSTNSDGTYLKYTWSNISEYYSGGTRLSSFSTTIKPSGEISTNYYSVNLNSSNAVSGVVGDVKLDEFEQFYAANSGTSITSLANWTRAGTVTECTTCGLVPPQQPETLVNTPEVVLEVAAQETVSATPPQTSNSASAQTSNTSSASGSPPQQDSARSKTALTLVSQVQQAAIVQQSVLALVATQEQSVVEAQAQSAQTMLAAVSTLVQPTISFSDPKPLQTTSNTVEKTAVSVVVGPTAILTQAAPEAPAQDQQPPANSTTANSTNNSQLSAIAQPPTGYADYLNLTIKDTQFYVVATPYPNQKTVDNIRALRQLSTERLHQQMVEAQYR